MYTIKFKAPGWLFAKKVKNVTSHWLDDMASQEQRSKEGYVFGPPVYWGVRTKDDNIKWIPLGWFFETMPDYVAQEQKRINEKVNR
jgi:hypothetical protein